YDLWTLDQAGTIGDNDPRIAVFGEFGDLDVLAAAERGYSAQRLGVENADAVWAYHFRAGYNLKPARLQLDVVWMRDRFFGAETGAGRSIGVPTGFQGQKLDSVQVIGSWTGRVGPVRGLLQGSIVTGNARGGVRDLPSAGGFPINRP